MQLLKEMIIQHGRVIGNSVLKVDSFLNHQIDVSLMNEIGKEFKHRFKGKTINKILTIEASGIAVAVITAQYFKVPVVFAKKQEGSNMDSDKYVSETYSFTKNKNYSIFVSKQYLSAQDSILIIDDFLAHGNAIKGLADIAKQSGAQVVGAGIVIEKEFQKGREVVEKEGIHVESLAIIQSMSEEGIQFRNRRNINK